MDNPSLIKADEECKQLHQDTSHLSSSTQNQEIREDIADNTIEFDTINLIVKAIHFLYFLVIERMMAKLRFNQKIFIFIINMIEQTMKTLKNSMPKYCHA